MLACFLCLRHQQQSIERAMDLTDSFTWEDLPTTDADTGHLTAAGWIPRINVFGMRAVKALAIFHFSQSTFRIVLDHETFFIAWYPFDWTVSPIYELVNISQVTIYINSKLNIIVQTLLILLLTEQSDITDTHLSARFLFSLPYFSTTLWSCQPIQRWMLGWLIIRNWKEFPVKPSWPNRSTMAEFSLRYWEKIKTYRISGDFWTEIYSATAVKFVQANGRVNTWHNVVSQ